MKRSSMIFVLLGGALFGYGLSLSTMVSVSLLVEHALPRPDWGYYPSWSFLSAALSLEEDDLWANLLAMSKLAAHGS